MRVLHVHSGNLYGGVETLLKTLHRYGEEAGLHQEFALCFEGRVSRDLRAQKAVIWNLGPVRAIAPWTVLRARKTLRRILFLGRFDVVITHMSWTHALFAPAIATAQTPVVNWQHNEVKGTHWTELMARGYPPATVIATSNLVSDGLCRLFPHVPREVLYCAVEACGVRRSRVENRIVIMHASRFQPWKGQRQLLEALGRLRGVGGWECRIAGGAQRNSERRFELELRQLAVDLGIADRVRFLGLCENVPALLAEAHIYCQPNTEAEAFGVSYVEALAAGVPVVATALGGALEIVTPNCGLLVNPGDLEELRQALHLLITSDQLRDRLGSNGPARAAELCSPRVQVRKLRTILGGVVRCRPDSAVQA